MLKELYNKVFQFINYITNVSKKQFKYLNLLQLGLHITEFKSILESALDLSRDMHKNMAYINMSVESINKELDTQKSMPDLPVNAIYVRVSI